MKFRGFGLAVKRRSTVEKKESSPHSLLIELALVLVLVLMLLCGEKRERERER